MIFKFKKHNNNLYNILLNLSRNIFFYNIVKLPDSFETRIYLMFIHFSIIMIIFKNKNQKFNQDEYDNLFHNIENNLRELGLGDVAVNKKMKDLNKILYDILIKIKLNEDNDFFKLNHKIIAKYYSELSHENDTKFIKLEEYFSSFFDFCLKLPLDNMLKKVINFKY